MDAVKYVFMFILRILLIMSVINIFIGIIAVNMAGKRGLRTVPAFFAGLFGSFLSLFIIAMIPKQTNEKV